MSGFDRTGAWAGSPISNHSDNYHVNLIDTEQQSNPTDVEIGYRPLIYMIPSRSFDWTRLFKWLLGRSSN